MASLRLLNCSCSSGWHSPSRITSVAHSRCVFVRNKARIVLSRAVEDGGSRDVDSLFAEELKRRGLSSVDDIPDSPDDQAPPESSSAPPPRWASAFGFGGGQQADEPLRVPTEDQLERSRRLNAEGLEGLIPRGTELLKLGLSFFLGFGPLIVGVTLASLALYSVFGSSFIHGGAPASTRTFVDAEALLAEPTADPMIPFSDEMRL